MRKTMVIAVREYNAAVRTKAFLISVIAMPVLMGGGIIGVKLMENNVDTTDKNIVLIDRSGVIAPVLKRAAKLHNEATVFDKNTKKKVRPACVIETTEPDNNDPEAQRLKLSEKIREKEIYAFIEVGKDVVNPKSNPGDKIIPENDRILFYAENSVFDDMRTWMSQPINNHLRSLRLAEVNLDAAVVDQVTRWTNVESHNLLVRDEKSGKITESKRGGEGMAIIVPMIMMMLMFMMVMLGAAPLINAILEEKMQRIAEVLLGSVKPFQIMMGKLLGTIGVSFTVALIYVAGGILAAQRMDMSDYIPYYVLPWFFTYQVAAIFMFGAIFIAIGSACNDLKEAQSLMMPVWIVVMLPMFVWMSVVKEPSSSLSTALSFVPPWTPMLMLLRQATPSGVPGWQPFVGLLGTVLFTIITVWVAGRIFRVGILLQGKPPKLGEILRWAFRG